MKDDLSMMASAVAFELPTDHDYHEFVEVIGAGAFIFARIEKHRVIKTDKSFKV